MMTDRVEIHRAGTAVEVAHMHSIELREPTSREVQLRMLFSPINPADLNFIEGTYGKKPVFPAVPGIEGCGIVEKVGDGVSEIALGQLAIVLGGIGCWSARIVRPAAELFVLPQGMDPMQACMLRVNPATAWGLLRSISLLPKDSWVVQNAGSSGAGHCIMQLARAWGLRTISLVRRSESIAAAQALEADAVFLDDASAPAALREVTRDAPPMLALNAVGGESALRLMDMLAPGGTMVTYGAMARQPIKVPNGFLIFKDVRLKGFWLTRWAEAMTLTDIQIIYEELAGLVIAGKIIQPIAHVYALENISDALRHASESRRGGKVLLAFPS